MGAIRSYSNVYAYVSDFSGHWTAPGEEGLRANAMWDNAVIFAPSSSPLVYHECSWKGPFSYNNTLYSAEGVKISGGTCGNKNYTLREWQALAPAVNDVGSSLNTTMPSADEIISWGAALLMP